MEENKVAKNNKKNKVSLSVFLKPYKTAITFYVLFSICLLMLFD